jgi:hypothetical protein
LVNLSGLGAEGSVELFSINRRGTGIIAGEMGGRVHFDLGATLALRTTEFAEFTETDDKEVKFSRVYAQ